MRRKAALALGAGLLTLPPALRAQSLIPIRAGGVPEDSVTPALWAVQAGLFRKRGLDVTIDAQRSGSATTAAVIGGAYQFGKSSLIALISAHAHDVPLVLIAPAGVYVSNAHSGLIVKAGSPIRTGADLNGKTIAVSALNDLYTIGTYSWVDAHGGDASTVKLVEIPIGAVAQAVVSGRVDAGNTIDPELADALRTKQVRYLADTDAAIAPHFIYTAWFTTTDYLRANPATVAKFRDALREAAGYANAHPAQTVAVLAKFSGVDPGVVAKTSRILYGTTLDPALLQPVINATAKYKVIPAPFDARDFIDAGS